MLPIDRVFTRLFNSLFLVIGSSFAMLSINDVAWLNLNADSPLLLVNIREQFRGCFFITVNFLAKGNTCFWRTVVPVLGAPM